MKIKFIEEEHKYIGEDDSEYLSVSGLIHNLELKKDWDKIRKNYAKKNGGTAQEWKDKWEAKAKKSTEAGTILHEAEEDALLAAFTGFTSAFGSTFASGAEITGLGATTGPTD